MRERDGLFFKSDFELKNSVFKNEKLKLKVLIIKTAFLCSSMINSFINAKL